MHLTTIQIVFSVVSFLLFYRFSLTTSTLKAASPMVNGQRCFTLMPKKRHLGWMLNRGALSGCDLYSLVEMYMWKGNNYFDEMKLWSIKIFLLWLLYQLPGGDWDWETLFIIHIIIIYILYFILYVVIDIYIYIHFQVEIGIGRHYL